MNCPISTLFLLHRKEISGKNKDDKEKKEKSKKK